MAKSKKPIDPETRKAAKEAAEDLKKQVADMQRPIGAGVVTITRDAMAKLMKLPPGVVVTSFEPIAANDFAAGQIRLVIAGPGLPPTDHGIVEVIPVLEEGAEHAEIMLRAKQKEKGKRMTV